MNTMRLVATVVLAAGMLAAGPVSTAAQSADELFDRDVLQEIRLYINSRDLQELRSRYLENVYYTADLQWGGLRVRNAAVRVRGRATRSPIKPALRVDFDRYVTGQRFLGMRSLVLDNGLKDPSLLRDALTMSVFARMGQPAPREAFCRLFINNVDHGLYGIVEAIEPEFLQRTLNEDTGYLYEYHYPGLFFGQELGDDLSTYRATFEPRTHRLEADTSLFSPIRDLFHEVNQPVDAVWRERVERYLDLPAFVSFIAIDTFVSDTDGLLGSNGMNNFYLYRMAGGTVHRFIPWDKDLAMGDFTPSIFVGVEENALARAALSFSDLRALYLDVLKECARVSLEDGWLSGEVERLATLTRPVLYADRATPFTNDEVEQTIQEVTRFAAERPGVVLKAIAAAEGADIRH